MRVTIGCRTLLVAAVVSLSLACSDFDPEPLAVPIGPEVMSAASSWQLVPWQSFVEPEEAHFARISEILPGFGGFSFDERGNLIVWTKDLANEAQLVELLTPVLLSRPTHTRAGWVPERTVIVKEGTYDFLELAWWREMLLDRMARQFDALIYSTANEVRNRLVVWLPSSEFNSAKSQILDLLLELEIPSSAVEIESYIDDDTEEDLPLIKGVDAQHYNPLVASGTLSQMARPLRGGYEIGWPNNNGLPGCTLGVVAVRDGQEGFITNSHCSERQFETDTTQYFQPAIKSPSFHVGQERYDRKYYRCGVLQRKCRISDSNFVAVDVEIDLGRVARTLNSRGSTEIDPSNPYFTITGISNLAISGDIVDAIGANTGWTSGKVIDTCISLNTGNFRTRCQDIATYDSDSGDSGGPVFIWHEDSTITLYGIHNGRVDNLYPDVPMSFARFSRIEHVLNDLGNISLRPNQGGGGPPGGGGPGCVWDDLAGEWVCPMRIPNTNAISTGDFGPTISTHPSSLDLPGAHILQESLPSDTRKE